MVAVAVAPDPHHRDVCSTTIATATPRGTGQAPGSSDHTFGPDWGRAPVCCSGGWWVSTARRGALIACGVEVCGRRRSGELTAPWYGRRVGPQVPIVSARSRVTRPRGLSHGAPDGAPCRDLWRMSRFCGARYPMVGEAIVGWRRKGQTMRLRTRLLGLAAVAAVLLGCVGAGVGVSDVGAVPAIHAHLLARSSSWQGQTG